MTLTDELNRAAINRFLAIAEATELYGEPARCVHATGHARLCESCTDDWLTDPTAYEELGEHPEGQRRWRELQARLAADAAAFLAASAEPCPESDIPY
jgi:hypothetical protein